MIRFMRNSGATSNSLMPHHDIRAILKRLTHRYPMLLVDRVMELSAGDKIVALKNVTINEPFFQGHFPENPIMPGVLIIEAMAQAGGLLLFATLPEERRDEVILFMGMDKVRFRRPVRPGDQLILTLNMVKMRKKVFKVAGFATVDDKCVAEAELLASIGDDK